MPPQPPHPAQPPQPPSPARDAAIARFRAASAGFAARLAVVQPQQWAWPTPCSEWSVRQLANHMTRGNLNFAALARGGPAADFVRLRDADALGADPAGAYALSVAECAAAFGGPGVLARIIDYPVGAVTAAQVLAIRTADSLVHTWDLARAIGADEELDPGLVAWADEHMAEIYAGLPEMPTSERTTHRFFAAPGPPPAPGASRQALLLHRTGRVSVSNVV